MNKQTKIPTTGRALANRYLLFFAVTVLTAPKSISATEQPLELQVLSNCKTAPTDQHPFVEYMTTMSLLKEDQPDEAVCCFYRGQLRYRIYLSARPNLKPSTEPALFDSLHASVGSVLNKYAFNDLEKLLETIDEVLTWHEHTEDIVTPKNQYPEAHEDQRAGLLSLRARFQEELENRGKSDSEMNR